MNSQPANTPQDLDGALDAILADVFALYLKTKHLHWHLCSPPLREVVALLNTQAEQLFAMAEPIANRIPRAPRRGPAPAPGRSHIMRNCQVLDEALAPDQAIPLLAELGQDNRTLGSCLQGAKALCQEQRDAASARLIEGWIADARQRAWTLCDGLPRSHSTQRSTPTRH